MVPYPRIPPGPIPRKHFARQEKVWGILGRVRYLVTFKIMGTLHTLEPPIKLPDRRQKSGGNSIARKLPRKVLTFGAPYTP